MSDRSELLGAPYDKGPSAERMSSDCEFPVLARRGRQRRKKMLDMAF
jgi:hypothetical protein